MSKSVASLSSMTGFGRGSFADNRFAAEVELRSVNGKGLGIKLRLPSERMESEAKLEMLIRKSLNRGTIQGQVRLRSLERRASAVDHGLMSRYLKEWRALEKELGLEQKDPGLAELLAMPGALEQTPESASEKRAAARVMTQAFSAALERLCESRLKEGARLKRELLRLIGKLAKNLAAANKRVPVAQKESFARMQKRVQEACQSVGVNEPIDLSRELVVLTERSDVQEEVARLEMHIHRLRSLIDQGASCGRELEFMIQECHREVTTLGNKSSDVKLSDCVVQMKVLVGQLKEQVANVE